MAKGWVAKIMRQGCCFGNLRINSTNMFDHIARVFCEQLLRDASRNLGNLHAVREPIMEYIPLVRTDDLGDSLEPPESIGVQDTVTITLEIVALIGRRVRMLAIPSLRLACHDKLSIACVERCDAWS